MMHRDLLPLQRKNKRTDMKEKSINIWQLIKHFSTEFSTKTFFQNHTTAERIKPTVDIALMKKCVCTITVRHAAEMDSH